MQTTEPPLKTVGRAFEIIELLREMDGARLSDLSDKLDAPQSTVHDYLRSLNTTKYVTKVDDQYQLSDEFIGVGLNLMYQNRLFQTAKPEMEKLAENTGELIGLNILTEGRALVLNQERGEQALNLGTHPGSFTPLHSHAGGKVLLAQQSEDQIKKILETSDLPELTSQTITEVGALKSELDEIREENYAVDWDEHVNGMGMVAIPIKTNDEALGSLSIITPTGRITNDSYQNQLLQKLQSTVETIVINYKYGT